MPAHYNESIQRLRDGRWSLVLTTLSTPSCFYMLRLHVTALARPASSLCQVQVFLFFIFVVLGF
jgi:hypothetical protein